MKVTGIALIVIGFALLIFAGVSHFALAPGTDSNPSAGTFSPALTLVIAALAAIAGALILRFGGKGYTEKTVRPVSLQK